MNTEFENYYLSLFKDRWRSLRQALIAQEIQVARLNSHSEVKSLKFKKFHDQYPSLYLEFLKEIPRDEKGVLVYYIMDPASYIVAHALEVQPEDAVLDMCAAPGGKTLVLAESLKGKGTLIANELSQTRRERLKKVLQQYIPRAQREHIYISGKEGGKFALTHAEFFDKILVDAPCSGERHLLQSPGDYAQWSLKKVKSLAQRQYALLTAALVALKPGGRIVYSTCALNPGENDGVLERLLDKKKNFKILNVDLDVNLNFENTKYGTQFMPDTCGFGPMYFSVIQKD